MSPFDVAYELTRRFEGGDVDDPTDHGGRTSRGVTQAAYDEWRERHGLPVQDVFFASEPEVLAIYNDYWEAADCDALPDKAAVAHFDAAFNSNPRRAVKLLQEASGVPIDGILGPQTLAAANGIPQEELVAKMLDARRAFYHGLATKDPSQAHFLPGWLRRLDQLAAALLPQNIA